MTHDTSRLDAAILAARENPSEENREAVMTAMVAHTDSFHEMLATEYVDLVTS